MPTIKEAVTEELMKRGLKIYLGGYHDFTLDELKRLGFTMAELYASIAERVNPEWKQLISSDREAFNKFWIEIDAAVEGHGYYMLGERHDTPLIKARPDAPPPAQAEVSEEFIRQKVGVLEIELENAKKRMEVLQNNILDALDAISDAVNILKEGIG